MKTGIWNNFSIWAKKLKNGNSYKDLQQKLSCDSEYVMNPAVCNFCRCFG